MLVAVVAEMAQQLAAAVAGRKVYAFSISKLCELTAEYKPSLILLGARLGGTGTRAVEYIPQLTRFSPGCHVVLLTHRPSRSEIVEALELGAFGTVDLDDRLCDWRLDRIIAASARHRRAFRAVAASVH